MYAIMLTSPKANFLILLLVCYVAFFHKLGQLRLIGEDEPRYAEVAQEMLESRDFVVPMLNKKPWFEKPPLYYWLTVVSFKIFGVTDFSARVSSAVLALAGVFITYYLGRKVFSERTGLFAGLILATSLEYIILGRGASTDLPLSVTLTFGLSFFYLGLLSERPQKIYWFWMSYAFFGLATLAKGPVGMVLPALIVLAYLWISREYERIYEIQLIPGCAIFLAVAAPWYVLVIERARFDFIATFFLNHNLARFFTPIHHHVRPFYFFLPVLLIGFFPWSSFFPAMVNRLVSIRLAAPNRQEKALLFLWVWLLVPLLVFSISRSKLPGYILPIIPALALLVGHEWEAYLNAESSDAMRFCVYLYMALALAAAIGVPLFFHRKYGVPFHLCGIFFSLFVVSVVALFHLQKHKIKWGEFLNLVMTVLLFIVLVTHFVLRFIEAKG